MTVFPGHRLPLYLVHFCEYLVEIRNSEPRRVHGIDILNLDINTTLLNYEYLSLSSYVLKYRRVCHRLR
jgi:hypothetical protein